MPGVFALSMKVSSRISDITGWFLFLFFTGTALASFVTHQFIIGMIFTLFAGVGLFVLFFFGTIEMDEIPLRHKTLSGLYEIRWDEITRIESRQTSGNLTFFGVEKVFVIVGPTSWSSADQEKGTVYLATQIEKHQISVVETQHNFRFPRNARIQK